MKKLILFFTIMLFTASLVFATTVQIGTGTTTGQHLPIESYYGYTYSQTIYLASDFGTPGSDQRIEKIWYNYSWNGGDDDSDTWVIYMGTTTNTALTDWLPVSGLTQVFSGDVDLELVSGDGWLEITLDNAFNYNPATDGNLVIGVDENMPSYTSDSDEFYCDLDTRSNVSMYYYSDSTNPDPASPPAGTALAYYPNTIFDFQDIPTCPGPTALFTDTITTTGANLNWTAGGTETYWNVEWDTTGFAQGTGTLVSTNTNPHSLSVLSPNTTYDWYVQADCSTTRDSSTWTGPSTFTTLCATYSAPFSENFDSVTEPDLPNCWSKKEVASSSYAYVKTSTTNSYSAPNNVRMYNSSSTGADVYLLLITPELSDLTSQLNQIRFYGSASGYAQDLIVGTMSDPTDETTFTTFQTIPLSIDTYTEYTVVFDDSYTLTDKYIAFRHEAITTYRYLNIDDFVYEVIPACPPPTSPYTDNISKTGAYLNWTVGGTETYWNVEWDTTGFAQGTGTLVSTNTNPHSLSGLTPNTTYDWFVQADCSTTRDSSTWVGPITFTTSCEAVTSFPWTEGFEDDWIGTPAAPTCWSQITVSGTNVWNRSSSSPHSGTYCAKAPWASAGGEHLLITPELDFGTTDYRLKFWLKGSSSTGTDLKVQIANDNSSAGNFTTELAYYVAGTNMPTTWTEYTIGLSAYENSQYIAFRMIDDDGYSLYIDDVTVEEIPPVPEMILSETSHDFGYVEEGTSADWDVTITNAGAANLVIYGSTVGSPFSCSYTGTILPGNDDDATISFSPTRGSYIDTLVFHNNAACCDSTVVLTGDFYPSGHDFQGFEDTTFPPDGWAMTSGWSRYTYSSHVYEGNASAKVSGDNTSWLFTPALDINTGDQLNFYYQAESASYPSGLKVRLATVSTAAQTDTSAYTVTLIDFNNIDNTAWKDTTYTFDATYNGQQVYLAFQRSWQTATNWYAFIDAVIHPSRYWGTPATPTNPTPSDGATNQILAGVLDWDDCQYATGYDVYFDDFTPPTTLIADSISHSDTLYSGDPSKTYYWKVVAKGPGGSADTTWSFSTLGSCPGLPLTEDFEPGFDLFDNMSGNDVDWTLNDTLFTSTTNSAWNVYDISNENILIQICVMDLTARVNPVLSFQHIAKTEGGWDKCYVEISTDGGATWTALPDSLYHGSASDYDTKVYFHEDSYTNWGTTDIIPDNTWWKQEAFDLIPYNSSTQAIIRFRLKSDTSGQRFGWLIDDISIDTWAAPGAPTNPTPADNAINVALSPTLTWTNHGIVDSSIVWWRKGPPLPWNINTVNTNNYTIPDTLLKETNYEWYVVCYNPVGSASTVNPPDNYWHFTTLGDGNIDGIVYYDDGTEAEIPLENAVVTCEGVSDTTNAAGEYFLGPVPSGQRVITTERINFITKLDTVIVSLDDTLHYDIEMQWDLHPPQNLSAIASDGKVDLEWQEPLPMGEIKYDDNSAESWYYFSSADTNYFYCNMFNAPIAGDITHIALCTYTNGPNWYQVRICPDNGSARPDLDNPYESFSNVSTASTPQWIVLQLTTPQTMAVGDTFWVVSQYSSPSSNGPYLGRDTTPPDQDMSYYTTDHGSVYSNVGGNHLMRAYMNSARGEVLTLTSGPSNDLLLNLPIYDEIGNPKSPEMAEIAMSHRSNTITMSYTVPAIIATGTKEDRALTNYKLYRGTVSGIYPDSYITSNTYYTDNTASNNTEYFYVVSAVYDEGESGYSNEVDAYPMAAASIPYDNTFDTNNGGFYGTGDWEWGAPTYIDGPAAYSSPNVWGTVLDGDYSNNSNSLLFQPFNLIARGYGYKVNFARWYDTENNLDYGYFAVDHDNDGVYNTLATYTGTDTIWTVEELIIPDSLCTAYTKLAFIFTSDGSIVYPGFYIDNLIIDEYIPPQISIDPTSFTKTLLQHNITTDNLTIGNPARATQDDLIYTAFVSGAGGGAVEDFEVSNGGWVPTASWDPVGDWAWTDSYDVGNYTGSYSPPPTAHSGDGFWGTVINGDYTNAGGTSFLKKTFNFTGVTGAALNFYSWSDIFGSFDYGTVKVNGDELLRIDDYNPTAWTYETVNLSAYDGLASVEISFDLYATTVVERAGWYIDDVEIVGPAVTTWLTLDGGLSTSDTISVGNDDVIVVGFDATDLVGDSTYTADIIITSNDPNYPSETVNVTLHVDGPPVVNIEIVAEGDSVRLSWVDKGYTYKVYSNVDPYDPYPGSWSLEATVSGVGEVTLPTPGVPTFYRVTCDNPPTRKMYPDGIGITEKTPKRMNPSNKRRK